MPTQPIRLLLAAPLGEDVSRFTALATVPEAQPCAIDHLTDVAEAVARAVNGAHDALVVPASTLDDERVLAKVRNTPLPCSLVILRCADDEQVPLDPQDVGAQSTLDLWTLDGQTMALSLRLAIERHRAERAEATAKAQAEVIARLSPARDHLTGLPTGERLLEDIDRFVADAIRFGRPLTVALLLVDGLDRVRAEAGDGIANSVLIHAAGVVGECLRTSDELGRLDGDELLIVMPGTDARSGAKAARRIQAALREHPYTSEAGQFPVMASVGIAPLAGLMAVDELVFAADGALLEACEAGPAGLRVSESASLL